VNLKTSVKIESSTCIENVPSWSFEYALINLVEWVCQFEDTPSGRTKSKWRISVCSGCLKPASSWAHIVLLWLPWVVFFLVFPSVFVFVHVCLDQIAHLHWVDLPTLAVAHLMTKSTRYEFSGKKPALNWWPETRRNAQANYYEGFKLLVGANTFSMATFWTHLLDGFAYNLFVFILVDVSLLVERLDGELHLFYRPLLHVQLPQILMAGETSTFPQILVILLVRRRRYETYLHPKTRGLDSSKLKHSKGSPGLLVPHQTWRNRADHQRLSWPLQCFPVEVKDESRVTRLKDDTRIKYKTKDSCNCNSQFKMLC